jgi:hypothetical protein
MNIKVNDEVVIVSNDFPFARFVGNVGTVVRMYEEVIPPTAIVKFSEFETVKVPVMYLEKVAPQEKSSDEIPEGAKRITRGDFARAVTEVTCPKFTGKMSDLIGTMSATIVGMDITQKLFNDRDEVVMTEDQLVATLWDGCAPENVCETVNREMSFTQCMGVSLASIVTLRDIVEILFPDESKND